MTTTTGIARVAVATPLGGFVVEAGARGVRAVAPVPARALEALAERAATGDGPAIDHARAGAEALRRYAAGDRMAWDGALDVEGSALERAVWARLRAIPFGATARYGDLATALGMPGEARAVGAAVGANRVCVLVPCHRVLGADGSLKGFAWGLELKRRLLAHEGSVTPSLFSDPVPGREGS